MAQMNLNISIIAAVARDRAIGKDNDLLWHIPDDLKRFRILTTGHPVIMGRKTFESIYSRIGKPLPDRTNIVVTRSTDISIPGVVIAGSIREAIEKACLSPGSDEVFIIGGAQIYEEALSLADRLYLTIVDAFFPDADVYFPSYEMEFTHEIAREKGASDAYVYDWVTLERENPL